MPSLPLDCSELSLADVDEVSAFLDGLSGIEVPVSVRSEVDEHEEGFDIEASAQPLLIAVHFAQNHWAQITGGAATVSSVYKAGKWIAERLAEWNLKRKDGHDFIPIYDQNSNVVSIVKRRKAKQ